MVVAGELAEVGEAVAKKGGVEPPGDDPLLEQYLDGSSFLHKKVWAIVVFPAELGSGLPRGSGRTNDSHFAMAWPVGPTDSQRKQFAISAPRW